MTDRDLRAFVDPQSEFGDAARSAITGRVADPFEELLSNLPLTKNLIELLEPPLKALRFSIDEVSNRSEDIGKWVDYHCVQVSGDQHIALIHGKEDVVKSNSGRVPVGLLGSIFLKFCHGLFVFFEEDKQPIYNPLVMTWQGSFPLGGGIFGKGTLDRWRKLKGDRDLLEEVKLMLHLGQLPPRGTTSSGLSHDDEQEIIRILVTQSDGYSSLEDFLEILAQRVNVPKDLKRDIRNGWSDNPEANAGKLVQWALSKGPNLSDPPNSVLGTVLRALPSFFNPDSNEQAVLDRVIDQQRKLT